uniref:DUF4806 domain-containing protein n=1 Tax=Anopheles dirus TaxID=7168 RepID=A0A182NQD9_9DIPT
YKPGGGSPRGGGDGGGYYCRPVSLQLPQSQTSVGPPPFQRQLTPPCLSPTGGKLPTSPRRSCLVIRPDEATTPEETEPPHTALKMMALTEDEAALSAMTAGRNKKKVVFADDHGGQLTQVRVMREPSYMPPIWSLQFLAHVTQGMISPVPQEQWVVDFVQPASDYVRFRQKLDERNVSLENVIIKETEQMIVGTVKVKNLCYHKEVIIRSSCDSWKTHEDTFCTYSVGRNYSLTNRIAPRENTGAFLSSSSASAFNSANPGRNGMATAAESFSSPYVDPSAVLDTWSDMSVETQSGPYCCEYVMRASCFGIFLFISPNLHAYARSSTFDCSLNRCSNNRDHTAQDATAAHPQMKPISLNLSCSDGTEVSESTKMGTGERRASTGVFAVKKGCNHPLGTKPITPLGRSASSGKLFYIRERHEGEDLLANLLRLRKLMMSQNVNTYGVMDNCHNYATTSKKKRIPISDDIHIIIKKFRDKDKHDEKPSTSGDHDYDDDHSMDSEELRRVRHQEPSSSSALIGIASNSNSNSTTCPSGSTLQTVGLAGNHTVQVQQQQIISLGQSHTAGLAVASSSANLGCQNNNNSQTEDIKLILKKLSNIEELLKVVADQSLNRIAALKQETGATLTVGPGVQLATVETNAVLQHQQHQPQPQQHHPHPSAPLNTELESCFKFPIRSLKELIELNKSICGDESLYNKLFEHLTKIRLDCDQNIVINALTSIVSDEVLDAVTWDTGKKFKLSSVVLFSDSLYVAWFKDKMKYDEYVTEMKDAIERSHKRHAKVKTKRNQQNSQALQQQPGPGLHSPLGTGNSASATVTAAGPGGPVSSISCDNSALILKVESLE